MFGCISANHCAITRQNIIKICVQKWPVTNQHKKNYINEYIECNKGAHFFIHIFVCCLVTGYLSAHRFILFFVWLVNNGWQTRIFVYCERINFLRVFDSIEYTLSTKRISFLIKFRAQTFILVWVCILLNFCIRENVSVWLCICLLNEERMSHATVLREKKI